jgi:hypothetical protein
VKLWVDDIRRPPDDSWTWARTNEQAIDALRTGEVTEASLDHDMGLHEADPDAPGAETWIAADRAQHANGLDLVGWMCQNGVLPEAITIHTWNPEGAGRMAALLRQHGRAAVVAPYERRTA